MSTGVQTLQHVPRTTVFEVVCAAVDHVVRRLPPGSRVLELGAGSRSVVPVDRVESLYGVGLLPEHMEANKALTGFETVDLNAPGLKLNLPDDKFDAVLCNVLPYIREPLPLLREARRCMKEDGVIVVSWSSISTHEQQMAKHWRDRPGWVPVRVRAAGPVCVA